MIKGMAANLSAASKTTERIMNRNRTSFPFHPNDLNLKENIGISEIISAERTAITAYKVFLEKTKCANPKLLFRNTRRIPTIKIVAAGVARPMKPSLCLVSMLNFARRNAANKAIKNAGAEYK